MRYVYPAIFYEAEEGGYYAEFPDVKEALTQGETLFEMLERAEDALAFALVNYENENRKIQTPTPLEKVVAEPDEFSSKAFVTLIKADTDAYRKMLEGAA